MRMNLVKKGSIFFTFFGSCLALSLAVSALGTKWWIVASAKRTSNPNDSDGKINLGLFKGDKHLNVKYGWREYPVDVLDLINNDREFVIYGAWIGTIACLCGAILFSILSAIFAVVNTAMNPYQTLAGIPGLFLWNSIAIIMNIIAGVLWVVQFIQKLQYNVMSKEDREQLWDSNNMASLGYSFWFVIGAAVVHLINILVVYTGAKETKTEKTLTPIVEEKSAGAIMLY